MANLKFENSSPTRIDLAGGTLDCWPLYLFVGSAVTVNLSIDIMTKAELLPMSDSSVIELNMPDQKFSRVYESLEACLKDDCPELDLLRAHIRFWLPEQGFKLFTYSESPIGGGLGGSSSLSVSIIKSFSQWFKKDFSLEEIVKYASNIEAQALNTPTGTQDYVPAIQPGLNFIHYGLNGMKVEKACVDMSIIEENLMLVNTAVSHHSGLNNFQVIQAAVGKDKETLNGLHELALIAEDLEDCCRKENWALIPELFQREYEARIALSPVFTCPEIESLKDIAMKSGAEAVKICGAGGGGCVAIWTSDKEKVREACQKQSYQVLEAKPFLGT